MTDKNADKMKPSEKLKVIEEHSLKLNNFVQIVATRVGELETLLFRLARENDILKDAVGLMNQKLDATIQLSREGLEITDETLEERIVQMKVDKMEQSVKKLLEENKIELAQDVTEDSLVVSRELNKDGTVANPRLQFIPSRLHEQTREKFVGKKSGDLVTGDGEDSLDVEIFEVYNFVQPKQEAAPTAPTE